MKFDLPKEQSSIIKVIGVGGGGSNAVNHMFRQGIKGVDFVVCNTDHQALDISPVPIKIQLGASLTEGRGAGSIPDVGMNAAIENLDEIKDILGNNTKMVFVTAGMGGGTGTGAAPVIAKLAKDMGILTVGIVTVPFMFEGRKRRTQAEDGVERMRQSVDTLLIINNDKLREMFGNLTLGNAFENADDVLATAARGIAEVISVTGQINVDFNDVSTVMKDSGVAIMGSAEAEGEDRASIAVTKALSSPLLNDNDIKGAKYVLLNITYGEREVLMDEIAEITDHIQDEAGSTADVIWGHAKDDTLGEKLSVTIIATGFNVSPDTGLPQKQAEKVRMNLEEERPAIVATPIQSPIQSPVSSVQNNVATRIDEPYVIKREEVKEDPISSVNAKEVIDTPIETQTNDLFSEIEPSNEEITFNETFDEVSNLESEKEETFNPVFQETRIEETRSETFSSNEIENISEEVSPTFESEVSSSANMVWDFQTPKTEEPIVNEAEVETPTGDGKTRYFLEDEIDDVPPVENTFESNRVEDIKPTQEVATNNAPTIEDNIELAKQRIERIRQNSQKLKTVSGLSEMESEPAYKRRQIRLEDTPHSSESSVSRFTLGDASDENRSGLSDNNSFLHDNVD